MNAKNKILVCGASIAGPAVAYWLQKYGYRVVVVERAKAFRAGGQNIDIKGLGQQVIKMMGIEKAIDEKNTGEKGIKFLDNAGNVLSRFPKGAVGSLTSSYEILRGDLAQIMLDATVDKCEYRFGAFVTNLVEQNDSVNVTFNDGTTEDFELVICADGIGSSTRQLVMPEKIQFNYLGAYMAFFNIPQRPEDDQWAASYQCKGGAMVFLRPGHKNETTVLVTFLKKEFENSWHDVSRQKQLLREVLSGKGVLADRVVADLDYDHDIYFGPMSQVKASSWSKGRVVLLGDAAHAPTPFTGLGTSLSLVGAYVLAGEIMKNDNCADAFEAYERLTRPYVENTQKQISARMIRLIHQKSAAGIALARLASKFFASDFVQKILGRLQSINMSPKKDDLVLPRYPTSAKPDHSLST